MTTYFKLVIALAILVVAGTGFWLRGKYTEIKTDVYAKREADIVKYINNRALSFGLAPAFVEKNAERQQQKLKDFFEAIQTEELFRVKVFDLTPKIVWSNLPEIIGQDASQNQDAINALKGISKITFKSTPGEPKTERVSERQFTDFTETYLPVKDAEGKIVGVFEAYQTVSAPNRQIKEAFQRLAMTAIIAAAVAYLILVVAFKFFLK